MKNNFSFSLLFILGITLLGLTPFMRGEDSRYEKKPLYNAPCAVTSWDNQTIAILEKEQSQVRLIDANTLKSQKLIPVCYQPTAFYNAGELGFFIVGSMPNGMLYHYDQQWNLIQKISCGHSPCHITINKEQTKLAVCDQYNHAILLFNLRSLKDSPKIYKVVREPICSLFSPDGKNLFVANALPNEPSNTTETSAVVSALSLDSNTIKNIRLPATSFNLRSMDISSNGKYIAIPHSTGRTHLPAMRIENAWIVANMISLIDVEKKSLLASFGLDDFQNGAINPTAVKFSPNDQFLACTIGGTHELFLIQFPELIQKIQTRLSNLKDDQHPTAVYIEEDYTFVHSIRKRIPLNLNGPRALYFDQKNTLWIPGYFSDNINKITHIDQTPVIQNESFGIPFSQLPLARRGEIYFHDSAKCPGKWLTCATCHPNGRMDGISWDLMNDGASNSKNTRTMLYAIQTPPAMALGVRKDAETAIRAGFKSIQFYNITEHDEKELLPAVEAFIKNLMPISSPYLVNGALSESAKRGEKVFQKARCSQCHFGPYMTNNAMIDVGTTNGVDIDLPVNTPPLVELFLSAPYLHSGITADLREAITTHNPKIRGEIKSLSKLEIDDLIQYLLSL